MKVHCEADNVHTALHAHSTNFHLREKTQPRSRGSTAGLVPIPTGVPRISAPIRRNIVNAATVSLFNVCT